MSTRTFLPVRASRRGTELFLLIFACILVTGAAAAVALGHDGRVSGSVYIYGASFLALYLVAHLAIRKLAPAADPLLLPIMALINGVGLALIYRLDLGAVDRAVNAGRHANRTHYAEHQLVWTLVAVLVLIAVLFFMRDHRSLARYTYSAGFLGLLLLALLAVPGVGKTVNGARIQLQLGPIPIPVQPGEFSKLLLIVFFAGYLVRKREVLSVVTHSFLGLAIPRARDLGPVVAAWLASLLLLVVAKDLGTSLLFFSIFLVMLYIATERVSWLLIGMTMFVVGAYTAYRLFSHVQERVEIWLHPFRDPFGASFQLVQGIFGLATGGLFGSGPGRGSPWRIFAANTDFILASYGEELGAVGLMALLVLYGLLIARGLRVALIARDGFGKLLAAGLATAFALQVFVVAGGVLRVIPLTGLVLPFLAYGGSSLLANAALLGMLLRISDAGRRPPPPSGNAPLYDPRAIADSPTQAVQL